MANTVIEPSCCYGVEESFELELDKTRVGLDRERWNEVVMEMLVIKA